jgi:hypothetical protein
MSLGLYRRLVVVFTLLAFLGTGVAQAMTIAPIAAPAKAAAVEMSGMPMPCCPEKSSTCFGEMGCLCLVGIAVPASLPDTVIPHFSLSFWITDEGAPGRTIEPGLEPPILFV